MNIESKKSHNLIYEIKIKGRLDEQWVDWFDPFVLQPTAEGDTILVGPVPDQAALQGILVNLSNLNLDLISVNQIEADSKDETQTHSEGGA